MRLPVALVQLDATGDVEANIDRAIALAAEAAAGGARLVVLPEYLHYRGDDDGFRASARPIPGPFTEAFAEVARRHNAWILAGSVAETSDDPGCPYNTSVLLDPNGSIAATYRKIHLFDVSVDDGPSIPSQPASRPVTRPSLPMSTASVSVCRCVTTSGSRYRTLALAGAEVLAVPSNFTERTGRDHWEVLLRARAIENGAWVLALASRADRRATAFGRSMVIDPWGTVVAQASDGVGIIRADVETDRVAAVRRQIHPWPTGDLRPTGWRRRPGGRRLLLHELDADRAGSLDRAAGDWTLRDVADEPAGHAAAAPLPAMGTRVVPLP